MTQAIISDSMLTQKTPSLQPPPLLVENGMIDETSKYITPRWPKTPAANRVQLSVRVPCGESNTPARLSLPLSRKPVRYLDPSIALGHRRTNENCARTTPLKIFLIEIRGVGRELYSNPSRWSVALRPSPRRWPARTHPTPVPRKIPTHSKTHPLTTCTTREANQKLHTPAFFPPLQTVYGLYTF